MTTQSMIKESSQVAEITAFQQRVSALIDLCNANQLINANIEESTQNLKHILELSHDTHIQKDPIEWPLIKEALYDIEEILWHKKILSLI